MTPLQRLMLSGRQAAEQAQRLSAWLRSADRAQPDMAYLADEVDGISGAIGRLVDAVEMRPAVGVVGGAGSGRMALVAALTGMSERPLRAEFANREATLDVLSSVVPHRGGAQASVAIRLGHGEPPAAPRGFPVRLRLLGQLDLAKILFRAHAANIGAAGGAVPSAASVDALFREAERHLQPRAVAGLSARDIVDLREDLHGYAPRSEVLRNLAAAGYWDRLAMVVALLPEAERTQLLALVWNEDPVLTALYALLNGTLEKLGHAPEVFCELAAIVEREPVTGWMVPHGASVIAAETLAGLAGALGPVPASTVQVSGRFGGSIAVDRAVVAALAAELPLHLPQPALQGLPETDIVSYPAAPAVVDVLAPHAARPADDDVGTGGASGILRGGLGPATAAAIVGQARSVYLLERAVRRHQLVSLVVCIDPLQPPDDSFALPIGDWIETKHGSEAHHRERMRNGLFVVAARPRASSDPAACRIVPWREGADDAAMRRWLFEGIGADQDWAEEWSPNHRFEHIFAFSRPPRTATAGRPGEARLGLARGGPLLQADGADVEALSGALQIVATRAKHYRQLGLGLAELRRRLRSRLLRHHHSNDPLEIAEWRRQVANIAVSRLRRPLKGRPSARRDGRAISAATLVDALRVSEGELATAIARRRPAEHSTAALENPSICHDSAAAAVTYWLRAMRQAGRSARFCRHLGVPQTVLQHVLDEIAIGAAREGLVAEMTTAMAQTVAGTDPGRPDARGGAGAGQADDGPNGAIHLAATATHLIDTFLASIARAPSRTVAASAAAGASTRVLVMSGGASDARPFGAPGWALSVAGLVEANIAAAPGLVQSAERDRELGELLSGFASSPFEVEL